MKKNSLFLAVALTIFSSCGMGSDSKSLKEAMRYAGKNRPELEAVLKHYENDPQKLDAAKFLIANMPAHYSYKDTASAHSYYRLALQVVKSGLYPEAQRDSLRRFIDNNMPGLDKKKTSDVKIIKSDYLIHNIDMAFDAWKNNPWASHLSFDEFKEWILPYKIDDFQELDAWRDTLLSHYSGVIKSMIPDDEEYNTCVKTQEVVRKEIVNRIHPRPMFTDGCYPLLSAELLPYQTFGRYTDYSNLATLIYRSLGIPAVVDEITCWGRSNSGHVWYTILDDRGKELPSERNLETSTGTQFFPYQRISKVLRHTYAFNKEVAEYREKAVYRYPFLMCVKDVTDHYTATSDIEIPIGLDPMTGNKIRLVEPYAYIATFNGQHTDWSIVDFGVVKHGKAKFKNMGRNVLYIAFCFDGQSLVPIASPFVLEKNGHIRYITANRDNLCSIDVRRKFPESANAANMRHRIIGGKIQYSDRPDFKDSVTVLTVCSTNIPDKLPLSCSAPHRFWRFIGADGSYGSISELAFFNSDSSQIEGTPIGVDCVDKRIWQLAFDNECFTCFETEIAEKPDGAWVGLDFGKLIKPSYVRVAPKSDGNDILPGCKYELTYWDGAERWISTGIIEADGNTLHYDNIPSGALFMLIDHSRRWVERVFTINDSGELEWL